MQNQVKVFENEKFGQVRTTTINSEPWFCLADVCRVLEIGNPTMVKERLKKDGLSTIEVIDNIGRTQQATFIGESNLYKVIFQSRKPEAEQFADWVTGEVLPSIRKSGLYVSDSIDSSTLFQIAQAMQEKEQRIAALQAENQAMLPKAEYFDTLVERKLLTNFRTTAKELGVQERWFMRWLVEKGFLYVDKHGKKQPYAHHVQDELFAIKDCKSTDNWAGQQTYVTVKGKETFRLLLQNTVG